MTSASLTAIVAIFGTTISPHLFFWQASEEVPLQLKILGWTATFVMAAVTLAMFATHRPLNAGRCASAPVGQRA